MIFFGFSCLGVTALTMAEIILVTNLINLKIGFKTTTLLEDVMTRKTCGREEYGRILRYLSQFSGLCQA